MIKKYICFVAGKSGGHIIPALRLAEQWHLQQCSIIFFSTDSSLDMTLLNTSNIVDQHVVLPLGSVPHKNPGAWLSFIYHVFVSTFTSLYILIKHRPERIVSTGGYIALPVCISGWLLRIPIELWELNAEPGKAISYLAPLAHTINITFKQASQKLPYKKCRYASYPVRFTTQPTSVQARKILGIPPTHQVILILGGSQGSQFINSLIMQTLEQQTSHRLFIIHQTGEKHIDALQQFYQARGVLSLIFAYRADIELCYAAANFIVARAGAGTLFEIIYFGKPALIIPLEASTTAHQVENAYAIAQQYPHLFTIARAQDITPTKMHAILQKLSDQ